MTLNRFLFTANFQTTLILVSYLVIEVRVLPEFFIISTNLAPRASSLSTFKSERKGEKEGKELWG